MRLFLWIVWLSGVLVASEGFWQEVQGVQTRLYEQSLQTIAEQNSTEESNESVVLDSLFEQFQKLILEIKEKPYLVVLEPNVYFNIDALSKEKGKLQGRIKANTKRNNTLAVARDEMALDTIALKTLTYKTLTYLAQNWTKLSSDDLIENLDKRLEYIDANKMQEYTHLHEQMQSRVGTLKEDIVANYVELKKNHLFLVGFISYTKNNISTFSYKSLFNFLKFDVLTEFLNSSMLAQKLNIYLRFIRLDFAKVVLSLLILVVSWSISFLVYKEIFAYVRELILKDEDEFDEILIANLNKFRKPLSFTIVLFGLEHALGVLSSYADFPLWLNNIFYVLYTLSISLMIVIVFDSLFFIYLYSKKNPIRAELIKLLMAISKAIIVVTAFLLFLSHMGVNISAFITSLGIGGVAVALAAKDTISNFFGLLKIIFDNSFSQGDWIKAGEVEGTVIEIGFISTKVRTFDNALITVPNSSLATTSLKNWSKRKVGRRIKMNLTLTYRSKREDLHNAIEDIRHMLMNHEGIATPTKVNFDNLSQKYKKEQKLTSIQDKYGIKSTLLVYMSEFNSSSIDVLIYAFSKTTNWEEWLVVKQDVLFQMWEILEKHNLEFAFPSHSVYVESDENRKNLLEKTNIKVDDESRTPPPHTP